MTNLGGGFKGFLQGFQRSGMPSRPTHPAQVCDKRFRFPISVRLHSLHHCCLKIKAQTLTMLVKTFFNYSEERHEYIKYSQLLLQQIKPYSNWKTILVKQNIDRTLKM